MAENIVYNEDCMIGMARYPDKYFDLAVVDPPYGIGEDWKKRKHSSNKYSGGYKNDTIPDKKYFEELFRVSKNWIIWGYNYFTEHIGPTNHLIVWDKGVPERTDFYSHCEIAATSIKIPLRKISIDWDGGRKGAETGKSKIHPHQKPIMLYRWIFHNYAKPGQIILDTHVGSGSSRIAADRAGNIDFVGFEIDKDYFDDQEKRFKIYKAQTKLF